MKIAAQLKNVLVHTENLKDSLKKGLIRNPENFYTIQDPASCFSVRHTLVEDHYLLPENDQHELLHNEKKEQLTFLPNSLIPLETALAEL